MNQADIMTSFTLDAHEQLQNIRYNLFETQGFTESPLRLLTKWPALIVQVVGFVKQKVEISTSSVTNFWHNIRREILVKVQAIIRVALLLLRIFQEFWMLHTLQNEEKRFWRHHLKSSSSHKCDSSGHSDDYKFERDSKDAKPFS